LILDEATSALDPASEAEICKTLCELKGKLTIVAITHQRALCEAADRVFHLHNGTAQLTEDPAGRGQEPTVDSILRSNDRNTGTEQS
jgi:ATP-binding cassette subfamily C protein